MSSDRFLFRAWVKPEDGVCGGRLASDAVPDRNPCADNGERAWWLLSKSGEEFVYARYRESSITIMQSMDMRDCNGNVIFEGDILRIESHKVDNFTVVAKYDNAAGCMYYENIHYNGYRHDNGDLKLIGHKIEVIGNIYENPQPLEVQKMKGAGVNNKGTNKSKMIAVEYVYLDDIDGGTRFDIFLTLSEAMQYAHSKTAWQNSCVPVCVFSADFDSDDVYSEDAGRCWNYDRGDYINREDLEIFREKRGAEWTTV